MRIPGVRRLFRAPEISSIEREVDDELAFHFAMRVQELMERGMSAEQARAEAERAFGDVRGTRATLERIEHSARAGRRRAEWGWNTTRDLRLAVRGMRRQPGFTAVVVLTLALGIGANVTMFGIADRLLLRPPAHIAEPETIRRLFETSWSSGTPNSSDSFGWPQYQAVRSMMTAAAEVGAFYTREFIVGRGGGSRRRPVALTTPSYLALLGVQPVAGRLLREDEDTPPTGTRVAVVSRHLAEDELGGVRAAIGRTITIASHAFEVVGVVPSDFTGIDLERVDAWVPVSALAGEVITTRFVSAPWHEAANVGWLKLVVKLLDERGAAVGAERATTALRQVEEASRRSAAADSIRLRATLEPLLAERGPESTPTTRIALWLAGMSLVVLLIACANVANLLLARALRRRREVAVRVALGAGRGRLMMQLLTEGLMLALLGGVGALLVAQWGGDLVRSLLLPDVLWGSALSDPRIWLMAAVSAFIAGVVTAVVPVVQASRLDLVDALKSGAREGGGRRSFTRGTLVAVQAALSLLLLAGAGLFLRSLHNAQSVDLGVDIHRVLSVNLDFAGTGLTSEEEIRVHMRLLERLQRLPDVEHAAVAITSPFYTVLHVRIAIPGRDSAEVASLGEPWFNGVSPDYFAAAGTRILRGRAFTEADRSGSVPVGIVNERMARTLWPGGEAIGQCVTILTAEGDPCVEIVGVAQDVRWNELSDEGEMQLYAPVEQQDLGLSFRTMLVRTRGAPELVAAAVREEVHAAAPAVLFADVDPLTHSLDSELRPWRLGATVFTVFGALALVLAALGLYSVMAYDVAQRLHEMGVRIALGASVRDIVRLVVSEGLRVVVVGVVAGVAIAMLVARWIGPLLFDTGARDPVVFTAVALLLLVVAVAASLIPAWRAARISPGVALRSE